MTITPNSSLAEVGRCVEDQLVADKELGKKLGFRAYVCCTRFTHMQYNGKYRFSVEGDWSSSETLNPITYQAKVFLLKHGDDILLDFRSLYSSVVHRIKCDAQGAQRAAELIAKWLTTTRLE